MAKSYKGMLLMVAFIIDLAMSLTGVWTFPSFLMMTGTLNTKVMDDHFDTIGGGVALMGRMDPYSRLYDIENQ